MTIKKVPTNHPDLLNLVDELNQFFVAEWGEDVNDSYASHHELSSMKAAFIAMVDNIPVGCACWKERTDGQAEIKRMYVKPQFRGLKLADKLLLEAENDIKSLGYKKAVLETGSEMKQAIKFYEKLGYQQIPNFGEFINDNLCIYLAKKL